MKCLPNPNSTSWLHLNRYLRPADDEGSPARPSEISHGRGLLPLSGTGPLRTHSSPALAPMLLVKLSGKMPRLFGSLFRPHPVFWIEPAQPALFSGDDALPLMSFRRASLVRKGPSGEFASGGELARPSTERALQPLDRQIRYYSEGRRLASRVCPVVGRETKKSMACRRKCLKAEKPLRSGVASENGSLASRCLGDAIVAASLTEFPGWPSLCGPLSGGRLLPELSDFCATDWPPTGSGTSLARFN